MAFENLQHAARILKCRILRGLLRQSSNVLAVRFRREGGRASADVGNDRLAVKLPAGGVILALLRIEPREETIQILRVSKCFADEGGGVGVIADVFAEERIVV